MSDSRPLVTIITNTKNRANLLVDCIKSIQRQTYRNYEHIIADGGTDGTEEVVAGLSKDDTHIRYIKVPSGGVIAQTKEAFKISKGEFITFLDDDDEYLPCKIERQIELITSLPEDYGFIYGSMSYYDYRTKAFLYSHDAGPEGGNLLETALVEPVICGTPTLMFRREVFKSLGGTWIGGIGNDMSDWALVCKALKAGWKVGALKESNIKVYINHNSVRMSDIQKTKNEAEKYTLFHSYFLNEYADVFRKNPKLSIYHLDNLFCFNMLAGHRAEGFRVWKRLLKVRPDFRTLALLPYYIFKSFR